MALLAVNCVSRRWPPLLASCSVTPPGALRVELIRFPVCNYRHIDCLLWRVFPQLSDDYQQRRSNALGHYWAAESGMTVVWLVAKPKYHCVASGIGFTIVKITAFLITMVFPSLFDALSVPLASSLIAIALFLAFLAAPFLFPEVFGHVAGDNEHDDVGHAATGSAPGFVHPDLMNEMKKED